MFPAFLRSVLRTVRHAPDRALHAARRRALLARLRAAPPTSIGFICHGNICRSPYAAAAASRALAAGGRKLPVWSAGLIGPDRPSPAAAQQAAREHGIDLSAHRSRLMIPGPPLDAEWVFVMEPWQGAALRTRGTRAFVAVLGDLDPDPIETRSIIDPIDRPIEQFRTCYDRIDRCVRTLVDALRS